MNGPQHYLAAEECLAEAQAAQATAKALQMQLDAALEDNLSAETERLYRAVNRAREEYNDLMGEATAHALLANAAATVDANAPARSLDTWMEVTLPVATKHGNTPRGFRGSIG